MHTEIPMSYNCFFAEKNGFLTYERAFVRSFFSKGETMTKIVLSALPAAVLPYVFFALMYFGSGRVLEITGIMLTVAGLACAFALMFSARPGWSARGLAAVSMAMKLIHFPSHLAAFILALPGILYSELLGISVILILLMFVLTVLSGTFMLASVRAARNERILGEGMSLLFSLLAFVPLADVASSVYVAVKAMVFRRNKDKSRTDKSGNKE